jgi:hypothetical protein
MIFAWKRKISGHGVRMWKWFWLLMLCGASAEEMPDVKKMLLAHVKPAAAEYYLAEPTGIKMAITAKSPAAQEHVVRGLNLIHGGWDYRAYQHFIAALEIDPDCLMAHFGVVFSLLDGDSEYNEPRAVAVERALALIKAGAGSKLERGYLFGLFQLLEEGPQAAAAAFAKVAESFPNDVQLPLFEVYFRRSGFDEQGKPLPDQELAQEKLAALMKKSPNSPMLMHAWLMIRAENRDVTADLPMARKLCELVPDYPPYCHLLGHYEWRSGNHHLAHLAFSRCVMLFRNWMKECQIELVDCPEWIRAEMYRAVAIACSGDYESALAMAKALSKVRISPARFKSAGARMLWWEASTLEMRILMRRREGDDVKMALASLPSKEFVKTLTPYSRVAFYYQGLAMLLESYIALEDQNWDRAKELTEAMNMHLPLMQQIRADVTRMGELSHYIRAYSLLDVATLQLKGDLAMAGPEAQRGVAYNWFSGANERQMFASRMMPPVSLTPTERALGRYFESKNDATRAMEVYRDGLVRWPKDLSLLEAVAQLQSKSGDEKAASETRAMMEQVRAEN